MKKLTIEITGHMLDVVDDKGRRTGQMSLGEVLDQVVHMVYTGKERYAMHTPDEWAKRLEEVAKHIGSDFQHYDTETPQ